MRTRNILSLATSMPSGCAATVTDNERQWLYSLTIRFSIRDQSKSLHINCEEHTLLTLQTSLQSSGRRASGKQQQLFFSNLRISPFQHPSNAMRTGTHRVWAFITQATPCRGCMRLVRLHLGAAAAGGVGDGRAGWECLVCSLVPRSIPNLI